MQLRSITTFGFNGRGELGLGKPQYTFAGEAKPQAPASPHIRTFAPIPSVVEIALGGAHSISLMDSGELYAWGETDRLGQGINRRMGCSSFTFAPKRVAAALRRVAVERISCGAMMSVATAGPSIYTWGPHTHSDPGVCAAPRLFATLSTKQCVVSLACGALHAAVVTNHGEVFTWGDNTRGATGLGESESSTSSATTEIPTRVEFNKEEGGAIQALAVAAGGGHTLVLTASGAIYAWGDNRYGQSGVDMAQRQTLRPHRVPLRTLAGGAAAAAAAAADAIIVERVACGDYHSLAVDSEGRAWSFGCGRSGQLGSGALVDTHVPLLMLTSRRDAAEIGGDSASASGSGASSSSSSSSPPSPLPRFVAIAGGGAFQQSHTLAVDAQGRIWGCGSASRGQLGVALVAVEESVTTLVEIAGADVGGTCQSDDAIAVDVACGWSHSAVVWSHKGVCCLCVS